MIGDFNIHMDSRDNSDTIIFNDFLESFGLENRVNFVTHTLDHSLDLCITKKNNTLIKDMLIQDITKEHLHLDHHFVHMAINIQRQFPPKKTISYQKLKRINDTTFKHNLKNALSKFPKEGNLEQAVSNYSKALNDTMENHAPLKTKPLRLSHHQPWFNDKIKMEIILRRKKRKDLD